MTLPPTARRDTPPWRTRAWVLALGCLASSGEPAWPAANWVERDPFESGQPVVRRFEDVDGLPQNTVHALLLDRDGLLWAGTQDGAAYYDGQGWMRVDLPDPMRSNFVRAMLETQNGDLWVGSQSAGLARRRGGVWTQFEPGESGLTDDRVNALLESPRESGGAELWIGTHEGGLVRFDGESWTVYSTAAGLPSPQIWDLLMTGEGEERRLWIATGAGPATLRLADGAIEVPPGAPAASVSSLHETTAADGRRTVHVGTYGQGLWSYRDGAWSRATLEDGLPSLFLTDLAPSPSRGGEAFWIATDGGGLALMEGGRLRGLDLGATLSSRAVYKVLETTSEQGVRAVWLGTRNNGVIRLVDGYWRGFQPFPETPNVPINALLLRRESEETSSLWLGTDGYGVAVRRHGAWSRIDAASGAIGNDTVMAIAETRAVGGRPEVWIGTRNGGLSRFDGGRWRQYRAARGELPSDMVQALAEERDGDGGRGRLWVGTRGGLVVYDGAGWRREEAGGLLASASVLCLATSSPPGGPPELWVGTSDGLLLGRRGQWTRWGGRQGLRNPSVQSLHLEVAPSGRRTLWIGTDGGGVHLLDPDDPVAAPRSLESERFQPLPNGSVYSILEDRDRRIYLLTNLGVTRLTPPLVAGESPSSDQFTTEHGLPLNQGNRGAGSIDTEGRIWFGTVGGAVAFDPRRENVDRTPKRLVLTATLAGCADCDLFDGQLFAHDQNRFQFRLRLLSFFAEPLTRYRTELVGHDEEPGEWTRSPEREVSALASGRYLFRAWGRDAAGNVAGPVELAFQIRPAPWQTPWAKLLVVLALLGLGLAVLRARSRVHARREQELEEQVAARTRRLQRANSLLVELSYVDALTAIPNRRRFDELFAQEWQRSLRSRAPLGLVLFDIDDFKGFNDTHGHQEGDEALRQVATVLADGLARSGDTIARYGGEEFAVILPATDTAGAAQLAEHLRRRVEGLGIGHGGASGRRVLTVSCGAVSTVATLEGEPGELFRRADEAMYRAKRAGGNQAASG